MYIYIFGVDKKQAVMMLRQWAASESKTEEAIIADSLNIPLCCRSINFPTK